MAAVDPIVLVVDDDALMRDTVSRMVREFGMPVQTFSSAEEFLQAKLPEGPACLVLDVNLPGSSGFDVVAELARGNVDLPTIFMTGEGSIPMSVRAMKAGAVEFLTKPFDTPTLRAAIDQALERTAELRMRRAELRELEARLARLTGREREVLDRVVEGRLNKEIATTLGIVEQTVKLHRANVMQKLDADSVTDLVRLTERIKALRS